MNKDAGTTHLLVVADIWCQIDGLCAQVHSELDDRDSDVLVVAPPLTSRLSTFASDTDDNENWREKDLPAYLAALDIPSVRLIVPHDLAE